MTAPVIRTRPATGTDGGTVGAGVLVAGIGNVFLGDDGFGVEVVRRLDPAALTAGVAAADYGIRGLHLAYDLLEGVYGTVILVDAVPLDGPPGTLAVLEIDAPDARGPAPDPASGGEPVPVDGHGMDPWSVLRTLGLLGGSLDRVLVLGCRPAVVEERMGLSPAVRAVVGDAVRLAAELARAEARRAGVAEGPTRPGGPGHGATPERRGTR